MVIKHSARKGSRKISQATYRYLSARTARNDLPQILDLRRNKMKITSSLVLWRCISQE